MDGDKKKLTHGCFSNDVLLLWPLFEGPVSSIPTLDLLDASAEKRSRPPLLLQTLSVSPLRPRHRAATVYCGGADGLNGSTDGRWRAADALLPPPPSSHPRV